MKIYALEFSGGRHTTRGEPNKHTGRFSIAVDLFSFRSRAERDEWVSLGAVTSDMQGNCREAVKLKELRGYFLGYTQDEFDDYLYMKQGEIYDK